MRKSKPSLRKSDGQYCGDLLDGARLPRGKNKRIAEKWWSHLLSFGELLSAKLKACELRPHHVDRWLKPSLGLTTRNDRIPLVKTIWNWAVSMGYLDANPVEKMSKPGRNVRQE